MTLQSCGDNGWLFQHKATRKEITKLLGVADRGWSIVGARHAVPVQQPPKNRLSLRERSITGETPAPPTGG